MRPRLLIAASALVIGVSACAQGGSPSATEAASVQASASAEPAYVHELAAAVDQELADELLAMLAEDQAVRTGIAPPGDDRTPEELSAAWPQTDADNGRRMEEILDEFGWPGWSLVGEEAATAAWALIQHQDLNLELQKRGLAMLTAAVAADDASPGDLAYLIDRVRVAEGDPQVYGTQITSNEAGEIVPRTPIEDPERVDELRAAAGLSTLEEYYDELRAMLEETPAPAPTSSANG